MSAHATIWVCLALAVAIFIIDAISVKRLKRTVLKKIDWEIEN